MHASLATTIRIPRVWRGTCSLSVRGCPNTTSVTRSFGSAFFGSVIKIFKTLNRRSERFSPGCNRTRPGLPSDRDEHPRNQIGCPIDLLYTSLPIPLKLLSAPLTIPLGCCHITRYRRASSCGEAMARRRKEAQRELLLILYHSCEPAYFLVRSPPV